MNDELFTQDLATAHPNPGREPDEVRLVGESNRRIYILEVADIDCIEADGNYVSIDANFNRYLCRTTILSLETRLASSGFMRINRSNLVNLRRVEYVERLGQSEFAFTLRTGRKLISSRSRRRAILKKLHDGV